MTGRLAPAAAVRLVGLACLLLAVGLGGLSGWGSPAWWALPLLALAVAACEVAVVHLPFGRQRWTVSLTEGALSVALVLAGGAWLAVAVGLGVLLAQLLRRQPRLKLEYNVAQFVLAATVAQLVAGLAGGGIPGAGAGLAAFWLTNYLLVAVAVSLTSHRPLRSLVVTSAALSALHALGNSSIGLLAAYLVRTEPLGLLGLVVPLGLLWASYDQQTRRSAEATLFAELARGQERATGRSSDVSAEVVVTAAARLLGGADVELVLVAADGPVRYCGDETGATTRSRVDAHAFDEERVVRALGSGGVSAGVTDGRPWVSAVLGPAAEPQAVLLARRPRGSASFGRREVRLAQVLVGQAESWLSLADLSSRHRAAAAQAQAAGDAARLLGDLGASTTPALLTLRESADRLARLADTARTSVGVGDIVEELHLVERAVASLLGAIALAAEPDLLGGAGQPEQPPSPPVSPPGRLEDSWTTTGVLP